MKNKEYPGKRKQGQSNTRNNYTRDNHGMIPRAKNLITVEGVDNDSEFDNNPEFSVAEIIDFGDASDSGPQS